MTGFEYTGGIKNLKVGVGEVSDATPDFDFDFTPIPELSTIRNIVYNDENLILRKAVSRFLLIIENNFSQQDQHRIVRKQTEKRTVKKMHQYQMHL